MKKTKIALIVYDRLNNIVEWLRCYNMCNTQNAELIVIHNFKNKQDLETCKKTCTNDNIKYIPRINIGYDIGILQDICKERLAEFPNDWDYLFCIDDDIYPMNKNFISYFIEEIEKPEVGVVTLEISNENKPHVRTPCFMIPKDVSFLLEFPADPIINKEQCYEFESRSKNSFLEQLIKLNRKAVQASPTLETSHLWDTHLRFRLNRWDEFYKIFPK
jgi:hypothetical protein